MESISVVRRLFRPSSSLALLLLAAPATAHTQGASSAPAKEANAQTYRAGGKSIAIPQPSADLAETGSDYRVILEPLAPDTNRLLAAFVLPADMDGIKAGISKPLDRYALVEVLRKAEFSDIDPDTFKQITDGVGQQFGGSLDATLKDQEEAFNLRMKALNSGASTISFDKPTPLGSLFSKPDAAGFAMIMPVSSKGVTAKMITGIIVLRLQNRVVFAYLYASYVDEATAQWIRTTGEHWADAILKANAR